MNQKSLLHTCLILLLFLVYTNLPGQAQSYQFRNYGIDEGLPSRFVYDIEQGKDGYIWVATSSGLARFDGLEFHDETAPDSLVSNNGFPTVIFESREKVLWIGYHNGDLLSYDGHQYQRYEHQNYRARKVNAILEDEEGYLLIVSQSNGIFRIKPDSREYLEHIPLEGKVIFDAALCESQRLFLGTRDGLEVYDYEEGNATLISRVEGIQDMVLSVYTDCLISKTYIATASSGLFEMNVDVERTVFQARSMNELFPVDRPGITEIYRDLQGSLWISTKQDGLIKLIYSEEKQVFAGAINYREENGLPGNDLQCVFQDMEGNMWFGMYGTGLSVLTSNAFTFFVPGNTSKEMNILDVDVQEDAYLFLTESGIHRINPFTSEQISYQELSSSIGNVELVSLHVDQDNTIWIGTNYGGLYKLGKSGMQRVYHSPSRENNLISDIKSDSEYLWMATSNGVIMLDRKSGQLVNHYTTSNLLPHNSINQIYLDRQNRAWVSTEADRLSVIEPGEGVSQSVPVYGTNNRFMGVTVDSDGNMWCATDGLGVAYFSGDTVFLINSTHGLKSDFCYSIQADRVGNVWVGHRQGFSRISTSTQSIRIFDPQSGFNADCNPNAMLLTPEGKLLIGTNEGVIQYNHKEDRGSLFPPINNIVSVTIDDMEYPVRESYVLPYKSSYTVEIKFIGLNFSNPEKVLYRYQLENYDTDWSDISQERTVKYRLGYGNYQFHMMSYNQEGFSSEKPVSFSLQIRKPFWLQWWFFVALALVMAMTFFLVLRIRERAQKIQQQILEDELEQRTREVVKQKEEIEHQNKEITDSINYAQRIQASLLPSIQKLRENFTGAFVYFKPRDIVSGDFFWYDQIGDDKFLLVCADSTGHGVPGAFMSMIGSALIQEIVMRKEITKPSEILKTLDKEISSTLNQNVDEAKSNDGMDVVVCEFNLKTRMLRFASAMRPVILILDGEQYYIRGNRCSVGGEVVDSKFFDDQEYFLKPGDIIYMFSDGYPDQFGGEDGKKMKMVRLKELLDEIVTLSMDEQYRRIKEFFENWMGDLPQVDDVLFMGVQI